jgi:hypothetical protein
MKKLKERVIIERIIYGEDGRVEAIDIHDEKFGEAVFFQNGSRHFHGYYNKKSEIDKKYD